ncbi:MAG: EpsG family protein [Synechococcus sp. ELA057]
MFLTLLIGLRDQVGGDWFNYLPYIQRAAGIPWVAVLQQDEAGYGLLNWFGANVGGGLFLVDTISALIFSMGLLQFCRAQPRPWLALILAFPYLIVVVAMGYTRQSVAIGLECLALLALERDRLLWFLGWIALAATFHKTVLILMLLPAATLNPNLQFSQVIRLILLAVAGYGLFNTQLASSLDQYQSGYIDAQYQAQGALIRVLLCLLPALVFLLGRPRFQLPPQQQRIWTLLSFGALVVAIGLVTVASSVVIDRLALYLIPLQIFVGSRLPDTQLLGIPSESWNQLLIVLSLAVLLVWLLFAATAFAWLPYRNLLLPF